MKLRGGPTLFDRLVQDGADLLPGTAGARATIAGPTLHVATGGRRLSEAALRSNLLRELGWLLNTTNLDAVQDLSHVPEVLSSTLNYGLGDLSGTLLTQGGVQARARGMREAIVRFEPRVDRGSLEVEPSPDRSGGNAVSFVIRGDVSAAVRSIPVEIRTDVEVDTGATSFRGE